MAYLLSLGAICFEQHWESPQEYIDDLDADDEPEAFDAQRFVTDVGAIILTTYRDIKQADLDFAGQFGYMVTRIEAKGKHRLVVTFIAAQ